MKLHLTCLTLNWNMVIRQGLRSASRPIFYVGDINSVQSNLIGPVASSIYRSSKRVSNIYNDILNFSIYLDNLT
ncbi:inositol hexakisphosphate and diphosphoinositol-pentakisphosphate kinase 2 isoform X17 [Vespula squamosa]|uniref:Inositol hexakisphosphate and diphosphoinositol-pentakisphosphate kinase 2 isoform X17 n=1 Tax=Vespula squamosa TaxID=30214 RepID=A0ABD2AG87_VESSQ